MPVVVLRTLIRKGSPSALIVDGVSRSSSQMPRITASVTKGATIARCHVNNSLFGFTPTGRRA